MTAKHANITGSPIPPCFVTPYLYHLRIHTSTTSSQVVDSLNIYCKEGWRQCHLNKCVTYTAPGIRHEWACAPHTAHRYSEPAANHSRCIGNAKTNEEKALCPLIDAATQPQCFGASNLFPKKLSLLTVLVEVAVSPAPFWPQASHWCRCSHRGCASQVGQPLPSRNERRYEPHLSRSMT